MRHALATILVIVTSVMFASNPTQATDSLLAILQTSPSSEQKVLIYRNLADLSLDKPEFKIYLLKMYREASKTGDKKSMLNALNDIIIEEINFEHKDSVSKYTEYLKQIATPKELKYLLPLYRMRLFDSLCYSENREETINEELHNLDSKSKDICQHIASTHAMGSSFYFNRQYDKALPYIEKAMKMTETLPEEYRYAYEKFISWRLCLTYAHVDKNNEAIRIMERLVLLTEQNYKSDYQQRPFYKIELYLLQYYSFIISNSRYLTKEQEQFYWNKTQQIGKTLVSDFDKYNYFLCANNYYSNNHTKIDLPKAIAANDSLIKYAATLAPQNMPNLYKFNSELYEQIKDFKNALKYLKTSHLIKDSLNTEVAQKQLNELQVKYDLNTLNHEKTVLEMKNKQNMLIFLAVLLIVLITVCTGLYFSWRKEKRMKMEVKFLHSKAQESEKMKQEFINSICHEIRTPLNSIVGFSDLIMNEEIDKELRREFPAEIQKNTALLTSLVNSMLEVADLDVSEEKLPCQSTDIISIFVQSMEQLDKKAEIEYKLENTEESLFIPTNAFYLKQVVDHLLSNANKFTKKGNITLSYKSDENNKVFSIYVTDTGCGIPVDMQEEVFKRFFKLDTFTQGNGLGLYLCQVIVKRLGGEIKIDPHYTAGTRMVVKLPSLVSYSL